jgi:hypothetical protein
MQISKRGLGAHTLFLSCMGERSRAQGSCGQKRLSIGWEISQALHRLITHLSDADAHVRSGWAWTSGMAQHLTETFLRTPLGRRPSQIPHVWRRAGPHRGEPGGPGERRRGAFTIRVGHANGHRGVSRESWGKLKSRSHIFSRLQLGACGWNKLCYLEEVFGGK